MAEGRAKAVLGRCRPQLEAMAARLEQDETLEGAGLQSLLATVAPEPELFALVAVAVSGNGAGPKAVTRARARRPPPP